ncbi:hypothetical protein OPT61_g5615 [Boeremia exigua]|uniref:Uncharacterized protein n=1 Tax=Boeremia exigua TaxID=749465 RepID=A0ACC2I9T5_9PLEO|nr:hypothetical protein OPT61_g5615 [Boeremia exigua]
MRSSISLFTLSAICSWAAAAVDPKCTKGIQGIIAPLTAYPPASSFCKTKFPPATKTIIASPTTTSITITAATPTTTVTSNANDVTVTLTSNGLAVTETQTVTAATVTVSTTVTASPPVTATSFSTTSTTTVVVTVTSNAAVKREAAQATADARAAQWSSISKVAGAVLSTFCSCAVPAPLTTSTPKVVQTSTFTPAVVTSTSTVTKTTSTTLILIPTSTSVITSTPTTTVEVVSTQTITVTEDVLATTTQTTTVGPARPTPIPRCRDDSACQSVCFCYQYQSGVSGDSSDDVCVDQNAQCGADCNGNADCAYDQVHRQHSQLNVERLWSDAREDGKGKAW